MFIHFQTKRTRSFYLQIDRQINDRHVEDIAIDIEQLDRDWPAVVSRMLAEDTREVLAELVAVEICSYLHFE